MAQAQRESDLVAGRYRVVRELARGGVGAVYEALDESTGRRVALKRLLDGSADKPRLALLFEAEFDTLSRLRHPHIVEVFDYGIDQHGPYFTMELLDGQDLSELSPIPYRDACRYLRDVASSLALLHTRRRLHRDLSPRNVRITSDGRCRLLDFGTMASFGVADDIVGTPPLVPPEALRGTALDHRADLYSLGALAYRILSGRYPYRARQLEDLPQLWRTPLPRLRELAPELPSELDELVMSMLSLDPAFRPSTTYEVIDRLTAIAGLPLDADQTRTAQGYLVGSRLIGRVRQLESLRRRIARAHRERGGVILIEGNPGVGKSRLLDEAALQAQLSGALSVRVDARAHPGHYGVANAMAKAILEAAPRDAREAAEPYLKSLGRVLDAFEPELRARTAPGQLPAALSPTRSQLHNAVLNWLFDLAEDRTLVLLVDDLPRVDEGSAALLNSLALAVPQHRILLIATRRLVDKVPASPGVDALAARARRLRLHRLRREDTLALLSSLFGAVPNVELLGNWIHDVTTGTPLQIMELAHHLTRENIVRFVDGMWVLPPHIPQDRLQRNLAATLSARAAALPASSRALAEALSVRRGNLSLPLCMRLSDDKDTRALFRNLDELVGKGVLVSGKNGFHFEQDALRQVLLRQLPAKRAQRLHLRLGEALLQFEGSQPETLVEAGFNLILGGAEMRGADLVASAAGKLPYRGARTTAALPALEAALDVYEKWGRSSRDRLRLRAVLAGSMDKRATALYADATLRALFEHAGGERARVLRRVLGGRTGFLLGHTLAHVQRRLTPRPQRGPHPRAALYGFYRVAFAALSVRSSTLDLAGTQRIEELTARLAYAGPLSALIAETFRIQLLALRGDLGAVRRATQAALTQLARDTALLCRTDPAAVSGVQASLYIGLGMLEAHYGLQRENTRSIIEQLSDMAARAHHEEPIAMAASPGAVAVLELALAADQLRLALHLARAERYLAEAHTESRRSATLTGMHHQFEIWRNVIDCHMSMRTLDVAGLRRTVETFTHYVAEHPDLVPWLEIARAHLALCLGKPQEALTGYAKWLEQIAPGSNFAWDTLCVGHVEALLLAGEPVRARTWLREVLAHPVLKAARDSTSYATLEALLALAEAESQDVEAGTQRIHALARELASADHPLLLGFVHEVGARIAHRRRDETEASSQLAEMKRWYTSTRNPALLARGQRVQDSFGETRPSAVPVSPDKDGGIVTRVTTRHESGVKPGRHTDT